MTTVLAVLAVSALIVLPQWLRMNDASDRDSTDALLQLLRESRALAITARQVVHVHLDPVSGIYRVDTTGVSGTGPVTDGVLPLGALESAETDRNRLHYVFRPSGAASGDTVLMRGQNGARLITIDPWDGKTVVHAR